jgi:hypothetical protein
MHRYYMTAETRQAVIAESNRQIAARAAAGARGRQRWPESDSAGEPFESDSLGSQGDTEASAFDVESVFARLVLDLQETSVCFKSSFKGPAVEANRIK